jgi:hypothetical protein
MDSKKLEEFYRKWLLINRPQQQPAVEPESDVNQAPQRVEQIENIIFQNDIFELYIEKGKLKYVAKP